jgi:DNA-binding SARP family transcriptional activator
MKFGVLGTVVVRRSGTAEPVPGAKPRAVLAALLLDANQVVSAARLTEVLWGEEPPASAAGSLQNHVARLRTYLGADGRDRIETAAPGYLIRLSAGELDLESFRTLSERGYTARQAGDWEAAARDLRVALELWRGSPLADVASEVIAAVDVPRLTQLRLEALDARIEADMRLGGGRSVIAELLALTGMYPLHERFHALLMLAYHQAGHRGDALGAYQRARKVLIAELGVEPGIELRRLQQRILAADTEPVTVFADRPEPAATPAIPCQLPPDIPDFAGREEHVAALVRLCTGQPDPDRAGVVPVVVITGTCGIGKTTLAVHVAHRIRDRFPDGQLYVNLRGPTGPLMPPDVLSRLLRGLGADAARIPADEQERSALLRTLLDGKRVLLVLDDARETGQVRPLLPGSASCAVLVTSRNQLGGLPGQHVDLSGLAAGRALALFTSIVGEDRVAAEPDAAGTVLRLTAGLPLAIRIAAARLAARPKWPITAMAERLGDQRRLDELRIDDLAVRSSFQLSYADLLADSATTGAARAFRLFGLAEATDLSLPATAALLGTGQDQAAGLLEALLTANLLQTAAAGRYQLHDLLRIFAAERAEQEESEADRLAAIRRLLTWYLRSANAAAGILEPRIRRVPVPAAEPSVRSLEFDAYDQAVAWCEAERANVVAATHQAARFGLHELAWRLPFTLRRFFRLGKHWAEWIDTYEVALASARLLGDRAAQAWILDSFGEPFTHLGELDKAISLRTAAAGILQDMGDRTGLAQAFGNLGIDFSMAGQPGEARGYFQQALAIFRELGDAHNQARSLANMGEALHHAGCHDDAIRHLRQALDMHAALGGESYSWARTLVSLGRLYQDTGQFEPAAGCYRQAASASRALHDRGGEADALDGLGHVMQALNRPADAHRSWTRARTIYEAIGDPRAAGLAGPAGLRIMPAR